MSYDFYFRGHRGDQKKLLPPYKPILLNYGIAGETVYLVSELVSDPNKPPEGDP